MYKPFRIFIVFFISGLFLGFSACRNDDRQEVIVNPSVNHSTIQKLAIIHYEIPHGDSHKTASLLNTKGVLLENEGQVSFFSAAEKAFAQSKSIFEQEGDPKQLTKVTIDQAVNWMQMGDTLAFLQVMDSLLMHESYHSSFIDYYKHVNIGDYYHSIGNIEKAKGHYLAGLKFLPQDLCNNYRDILNSYLADIYLQESKLDTVQLYLDQMQSYINCPDIDSNQVKYYLQETYYQFTLAKLKNGDSIDLHTVLSLLYDRRDYATKMFANEDEFHLGDLYDQNTHRILSAYHTLYGEQVPMQEIDRLLELLYDNTWRKVKKEKVAKLTPAQKARQIEINTLLKEVNDFKNDFGYDNPAYERLYELLVVEADQEPKKSIVPKPKLKLGSTVNYSVFHSYASHLWRVDVKDSTMSIHKLDVNKIATSATNLNVSILEKSLGFDADIEILKKELLPNQNETQPDYIIRDPITNMIPFALLMPKQIIIDHTFSDQEAVYLNRSNHAAFSYSDETSLADLHEKEYIELASGLKECNSIHSILGGGLLLKDEQFTEESVVEHSSADIMHLSTHAIVNSGIRQDCYLLLNDDKGMPKRFYGYDIPKMNKSPAFVNLSACDTGVGYTLAGNGTYSISREFIRNGSLAVLKTLWPVDDKATYIFQTKLYEFWTKKNSLGESLMLNCEHMKNHPSYSHPYYWAGFILEGNPNLYLK